jgi:hypothetical protein
MGITSGMDTLKSIYEGYVLNLVKEQYVRTTN